MIKKDKTLAAKEYFKGAVSKQINLQNKKFVTLTQWEITLILKKKILVAGATGMAGRSICAELKNAGYGNKKIEEKFILLPNLN